MRISDWSSDVCSSDLGDHADQPLAEREPRHMHRFLLESARRKKFERAAAQQVDRTDFAMKTFPDDPDDLVELALRARPRRHHLVQTGQDGTGGLGGGRGRRSEEHTSELQSLMRSPYAVSCLINKNTYDNISHRMK